MTITPGSTHPSIHPSIYLSIHLASQIDRFVWFGLVFGSELSRCKSQRMSHCRPFLFHRAGKCLTSDWPLSRNYLNKMKKKVKNKNKPKKEGKKKLTGRVGETVRLSTSREYLWGFQGQLAQSVCLGHHSPTSASQPASQPASLVGDSETRVGWGLVSAIASFECSCARSYSYSYSCSCSCSCARFWSCD